MFYVDTKLQRAPELGIPEFSNARHMAHGTIELKSELRHTK